ncbi:nitrilase-related carbon-nitrogen hydrolase [Lachnospiraceae bacterium 62-35]
MAKVAVCQIVGDSTIEDNTRKMVKYIDQAASRYPGLDVVVFPECCFGSPPTVLSMPDRGLHTEMIAEAAKKHHINVLAGSFMKKLENGKASNTVYFYNRSGEIIFEYSKSHLMAGMGFREADFAEPGNKIGLLDTDFGRIGIILCYELRFPELARCLVMNGADILFCPAEFPGGKALPPRTDHWDILVRSMALTNLTWTVACNNYGITPSGENPFGRSMVVDPWGTVISQCRTCEDICYAELDMEYQESVRDNVGGLRNRRPELYGDILKNRA